LRILITIFLVAITWIPSYAASTGVEFDLTTDGYVQISLQNEPIAKFVWADDVISRPYFCDLRAPGGIQVTRKHPPNSKTDVADHATFHPGLWMAFGSLSGSDYWRLKARVKFVDQSLAVRSEGRSGTLQARFRYYEENQPDRLVCDELLRCEIQPLSAGYLLLWNSEFSSERPFWFGDQEEMGLGVRVATPIRAEDKARESIPPGNGIIVDAKGRINGKQVWGTSSPWCDYAGIVDGKLVGVTLICHPQNFRPSWFHARDYGLLVANPFGRAAFHHGQPSRVEVAAGEKFKLQYGVFVHSTQAPTRPDIDAVYQQYLKNAETP